MYGSVAMLDAKLSYILEILKFLNYSYLVKVMTGKPETGKSANNDRALSISGVIKVEILWSLEHGCCENPLFLNMNWL